MSDSPGRRQSRLRLRQLGITTVSRMDEFMEGMDRPLQISAKAAPRELEKSYSRNPYLTGHTASNFELEGLHDNGHLHASVPHSHLAVYSYDSTLHPDRRGAVVAGISGNEKPPTPVSWSGRRTSMQIPG